MLCDDLLEERAELDVVLDRLDEDGWRASTPAPGWQVVDQVLHLARGDDEARWSVTEPDGFRAHRDRVLSGGRELTDVGTSDRSTGREARELLRRSGDSFATAARAADPAVRVPWYGPDMSLTSAVTARIMETWAHGQDVVDALGLARDASPRLRHVAHLGWRTVANSFLANGRPAPDVPVRIELDGLAYGPEDACDVVRGPLIDFCLVVTRRRHRDDTALVAEGPVADEWLTIAQCYAGPPGAGRRPGA